MAGISKLAPLLIIILGVGIVGFVLSLGWSKVAGGAWDRDKLLFLTKLWGGIVLAGFVVALIA
jgi:hypothetical protein